MTRCYTAILKSMEWEDDLGVCSGRGTYKLVAAFDYSDADVRLVLRRVGRVGMIVATELGDRMSFSARYMLSEGDELVLQWRAYDVNKPARSTVADLTLIKLTSNNK